MADRPARPEPLDRRCQSLVDIVCEYCVEWSDTELRELTSRFRIVVGMFVEGEKRLLREAVERAAPKPGEAEWPQCLECKTPLQLVREGKWQSICDCWRRCPVHGADAINYHHHTDVPGAISGYICWKCQYPSAPKPGTKV